MHALMLALVFSAEPAPALKSLSGLNVGALKPWLIEQLPSLTQCVLPRVTEGEDEVSVQAQFARAPEVSVLRVEAALSDVACVRGVMEGWKRDSKQPSAGSFSFKYRFRPSAAQRAGVAVQARAAFMAMCPLLPAILTRESVRKAMDSARPRLPTGARVSLEAALLDAEGDRKSTRLNSSHQ